MDFQVSQLVDDDVFDHIQWGHTQSVGEIEVVPAGAASPAGSGAGDGDFVDFEAELRAVFFDQAVGDLSGFFSIPFDEYIFGAILGGPGKQKGPIQFKRWTLPAGQFKWVLVTKVPERITGCKGFRLGGRETFGDFRAGFTDPAGLLGDDGFYLFIGRFFRSADDQPAVGFDFEAERMPLAADDLVNFG